VEGGEPLVGAICDPVRDRLFLGFQGGGATVEGRPLRVSETRQLSESLGVTGFPYKKREALAFYLDYVERVLRDTQGMRRSGSAAMDLATLSEGQADFFWEFGLHPWDTAAGALLVREAGGLVGSLDGGPWTPDSPEILAANPWIFEKVVALFREVGR
jgi:myo-inositol-1(or 4)-monophosphatase